MLSNQADLLKKFYQNLKDRPLSPNDPYYVPYLEADPAKDPIANLRQRINWSEAASVNLLSGQRGSGKSTGLRRLKQKLKEDGNVVFLCDMRDYLNLTTPVEISDFFMAVMGGLSEAVEAEYDTDSTHKGYWERLSDFLKSEVTLEPLGVNIAGVDIQAGIKDDPDFKSKLQERMRGHIAKFVKEAHRFGADVVRLVRRKTGDNDKRVVLLLDSIEQIRGVGGEAKQVYESVENLFSAHADSLHLELLHVVYTVPPYLMPLAPGVGRFLGGGTTPTLPSVHVFHRDGSEDSKGLETLRKIIAQRCDHWEAVFSSDQLKRMACATGGDLRDFFRLIREVLVSASILNDSLPVPDALIEDAENKSRREMLPIAEEDKVWLRKIRDSREAELEKVEQLSRLAGFFDTHLVLNYRNGEDWYNVHPLLRDVLD